MAEIMAKKGQKRCFFIRYHKNYSKMQDFKSAIKPYLKPKTSPSCISARGAVVEARCGKNCASKSGKATEKAGFVSVSNDEIAAYDLSRLPVVLEASRDGLSRIYYVGKQTMKTAFKGGEVVEV